MANEKDFKKNKNVLGRGLAALIDDAEPASNSELGIPEMGTINEISLDNIESNPYQPRNFFDENILAELAESIKVQGIIQPITVRKLSEYQYQIISGERRWRASKIAGKTTIPAYVRMADDQQMLEMGLIENIQREDLNAIEISIAYQRLMTECNLKQDDLGERVGKNRATVANYLRLLKLPPDIQIAVRDNKISFGHARAIISVDSVENQLNIFKRIISEDLSVRKTEDLVRILSEPKQSNLKNKKNNSSYEYKKLQDKLVSHFDTKVLLKVNADNQGEIKIPFYSVEDFNRILEILSII
ncbi:MAG: ParB/RepB/Spo0J family partition protein [Cytophagales bacterium]|nr:MAG: ParB/RepB/Spo0J family partition protein [Cytophagales bacterium]